jgi:hypothetical protein
MKDFIFFEFSIISFVFYKSRKGDPGMRVDVRVEPKKTFYTGSSNEPMLKSKPFTPVRATNLC